MLRCNFRAREGLWGAAGFGNPLQKGKKMPEVTGPNDNVANFHWAIRNFSLDTKNAVVFKVRNVR